MDQLNQQFLTAIGWTPPESGRTRVFISHEANKWNLKLDDLKGYWLDPMGERLSLPPDYLEESKTPDLLQKMSEWFPGLSWMLVQAGTDTWAVRSGNFLATTGATPSEALMRFVMERKKKGYAICAVR